MSDKTHSIQNPSLSVELGYYLEFLDGNDKGRKIPMLKRRIILGRKNGDVLVRDIRVSSSHLAIEFMGSFWRLTDLGSRNGTMVGSEKVKQLPVDVGTVIQMGQTLLVIRQDPKMNAELAVNSKVKIQEQQGLAAVLNDEFVAYDAKTQVTPQASRKKQKDSDSQKRIVRLRVILGNNLGEKFVLEKSSFSVGRAGCDINLDDQDISRKHAVFELLDSGHLIVRDLASSNGTYVNQEKISNKVLQEHDKVQIGKTILLFESARVE